MILTASSSASTTRWLAATLSSGRSGNHEADNPPGLSSGRLPRPRGELRLPHQVDRDQRANHHLGGRQDLSRRRRRDLVGEPSVLHRAGACLRHGRAGGAVPPPVWRQREGNLTASGSLCASAITGRATPESGGPFSCPQMATDGGGPADPDIQEAQHPYRAPASNGTEVTLTRCSALVFIRVGDIHLTGAAQISGPPGPACRRPFQARWMTSCARWGQACRRWPPAGDEVPVADWAVGPWRVRVPGRTPGRGWPSGGG